MIPYLAVAAFCGLRAAEIMRLDWSEIHLTGAEKFVEVTAGKAKTASRRTVPIIDNCAAWLLGTLLQTVRPGHQSVPRRQTTFPLSGGKNPAWHGNTNGLRHSFISYRLAVVEDVGQVSLEAGNSPGMVLKQNRQLVRESEAKAWFSIVPPTQAENVVPLQAAATA